MKSHMPLASIIWMFCSMIGISFADMESFKPSAVRNCDEVIWITPTYKNPREYMKLTLPKNEISESLVRCFSDVSLVDNVDTFLMDSESAICGYLVFKKSNVVIAVFKIEPHTSNKKSARYCEWLLEEDGMIVFIRYGGLMKAFATNEDYRKIIEKINRPDKAAKSQIFKVYSGFK